MRTSSATFCDDDVDGDTVDNDVDDDDDNDGLPDDEEAGRQLPIHSIPDTDDDGIFDGLDRDPDSDANHLCTPLDTLGTVNTSISSKSHLCGYRYHQCHPAGPHHAHW